jgi:hypothetical protein
MCQINVKYYKDDDLWFFFWTGYSSTMCEKNALVSKISKHRAKAGIYSIINNQEKHLTEQTSEFVMKLKG